MADIFCRGTAIILVLCDLSLVSGFESIGASLTSVPSDIPLGDEAVDLSDNFIIYVTIPAMTNLLSLTINSNLLTSLPDVRIVAGTLESLILKENQISVVDEAFLDGLTSLTKLDLTGNLLSAFPDVPGPCPTLSNLDLSDNRFTEFPVLQNIGCSLKTFSVKNNPVSPGDNDLTAKIFSTVFTALTIDHNDIRSVPLLRDDVKAVMTDLSLLNCSLTVLGKNELKGFHALTGLKLNYNNFKILPDVSLVGATLSTFGLQHNQRPLRAHGHPFKGLTALTVVYLTDTVFEEMPNICHAGFPGMPLIMMGLSEKPSLQMNCDCHAKWWKMLILRGGYIAFPPGMACEAPENRARQDWGSLTVSNLTCQGKYREFYVTPIDIATYTCASAPVSEQFPVKSVSECANRCARSIDCVYFNTEALSSKGYTCSLTDLSLADLTQPQTFSSTGTWYALD